MNEDMNEEKIPQKDESTNFVILEEDSSPKQSRPIWVVLLAIFGIVAVLTALGVGIFQLAGKGTMNISEIGSNLGGLFRGQERLVLNTGSMTIASGEEVTLEVSHRNKSNSPGIYTIRFDCDNHVRVELEGEDINCNSETELLTIDEDVRFSLTSSEGRYADVAVSVFFISEESDLESDMTLTVVNRSIAQTDADTNEEAPTTEDKKEETKTPPVVREETPKTPAAPTTPSRQDSASAPQFITVEHRGSRYSDPNGTPDLKVTVTEVGYMDSNNNFVSTDRVRTRDRAAVKFTVENAGNKETGNWHFSTLLPVEENRYFKSGSQISLQPGDKMIMTLAFDNISYRGENTLYINVDPVNNIKEISELNNVTQAKFRVQR